MRGTGPADASIRPSVEAIRGLRRASGYGAASLAVLAFLGAMAGFQPTKGIAFASYYILGSALFLALACVLQLLADALRHRGPLPPVHALLLAVVGAVVAAGVAFSAVLLEGEATSLYWHLIFLAYIPAGLTIGAHVFFVFRVAWVRPLGTDVRLMGLLALAGSAGGPFLTEGFLRFDLGGSASLGLGLAGIGVLAHIALRRATAAARAIA